MAIEKMAIDWDRRNNDPAFVKLAEAMNSFAMRVALNLQSGRRGRDPQAFDMGDGELRWRWGRLREGLAPWPEDGEQRDRRRYIQDEYAEYIKH